MKKKIIVVVVGILVLVGIGVAGRLELPLLSEGFDKLWYVTMDGNGGFVVEEWNDEL